MRKFFVILSLVCGLVCSSLSAPAIAAPTPVLDASSSAAWGLSGGHQLWNHGLSLYTIGQWDTESHYWTSPPGGVSDITHPYIPRPNGALEWVDVKAINLGPGSCGWLYKYEPTAGPWGPAGTWRFLWLVYGYSAQSGYGLAYYISGLPLGKYQILASIQANGNGGCVWFWQR